MKSFFLKRRSVPSYAPIAQEHPKDRSFFGVRNIFDPRVVTAFAILALFASSRSH
ncbi:MAG: hypothetical protein P1V35_15455 [Planctomycetota bacterium]|nr:hypothetical protein [Planctomycetota bacterium]